MSSRCASRRDIAQCDVWAKRYQERKGTRRSKQHTMSTHAGRWPGFQFWSLQYSGFITLDNGMGDAFAGSSAVPAGMIPTDGASEQCPCEMSAWYWILCYQALRLAHQLLSPMEQWEAEVYSCGGVLTFKELPSRYCITGYWYWISGQRLKTHMKTWKHENMILMYPLSLGLRRSLMPLKGRAKVPHQAWLNMKKSWQSETCRCKVM